VHSWRCAQLALDVACTGHVVKAFPKLELFARCERYALSRRRSVSL
jgi:hypothetical protein